MSAPPGWFSVRFITQTSVGPQISSLTVYQSFPQRCSSAAHQGLRSPTPPPHCSVRPSPPSSACPDSSTPDALNSLSSIRNSFLVCAFTQNHQLTKLSVFAGYIRDIITRGNHVGDRVFLSLPLLPKQPSWRENSLSLLRPHLPWHPTRPCLRFSSSPALPLLSSSPGLLPLHLS